MPKYEKKTRYDTRKRVHKKKLHPTYRKFGGKRYELEGSAPNKRDATKRVKLLRQDTRNYKHSARYVKKSGSYGVYFRSQKKKR